MDNLKIIKQIITDLLKIMSFDVAVEADISDQSNIVINIQTNEAGFLIGQSGANLQDLQRLVRVLVNKRLGFPAQFTVDINNYYRNQVELLKDLANNMARQAINSKTSFSLRPMLAHERRIIHLTLSNYPNIDTESIGDGLIKQVVIRPKD